jgi:hypothetical protein
MSIEPENFTTEDGVGAKVSYNRLAAETLIPHKRNEVIAEIRRANGSSELIRGWNSRVSAGASWQAQLMGSAAGTPANYIALSSTTLTAANGDTTLSGELTSAGMSRALGTYGGYTAPSSLGAAASYTISKTFTATATVTVNSAALFNASSAGSMFVEANLSTSATLASGDTVTITWTINI